MLVINLKMLTLKYQFGLSASINYCGKSDSLIICCS